MEAAAIQRKAIAVTLAIKPLSPTSRHDLEKVVAGYYQPTTDEQKAVMLSAKERLEFEHASPAAKSR